MALERVEELASKLAEDPIVIPRYTDDDGYEYDESGPGWPGPFGWGPNPFDWRHSLDDNRWDY